MPDITGADEVSIGKTYAMGFWTSERCDNSLAEFPSGSDFSWGMLSFEIDGCDNDNYAEISILDADSYSILKKFKYAENGAKEIDLSQYSIISSTQDIRIRIELVSYI